MSPIHWLTECAVAQADALDPAWQLAERIAAGGGVLGYVIGGVLLADRFGWLRRKNGNGNGNGGGEAHEQRVVMLLEQIAHSLEKMRERAELDTREILAALNRRAP